MKSFIPWIGGKSLLAKKIISQFPQNYNRYIEAFGGGGSVLFAIENKAKIEVYNDANSQLVNLFRCIKYHCDELQREITGYLCSREIFFDIKKRMDCPGFTDIQRAAMFYICIRSSYGADARTYGCFGKSLGTDCFKAISERLNKVNIEHKDFENLIKQYDRTDSLFYCDPPYHTTENLYSELFTDDDHNRLNTVLTSLKGHFILSYNDDEFIRNLYKDFNIQAISRPNNLSSGEFKELIIKNY